MRWSGNGMDWGKVGGPASRLFVGGLGLFAMNPSGSEIWRYTGVGETGEGWRAGEGVCGDGGGAAWAE